LPDFEEDFEISEGATYKGHKGIVRAALKMTHDEFITCCDEGQFIIWNKKKSSMRGFTLQNIGSPIIEPVLCMGMTDMDRGQYKFLLGGLKGGNLLMYNRKKGGKKVIANVTKRKTDILAITDIKHIQNSRFFAIQDNKYNIYMYSSDWLYYDCGEDGYPVPEMKIK